MRKFWRWISTYLLLAMVLCGCNGTGGKNESNEVSGTVEDVFAQTDALGSTGDDAESTAGYVEYVPDEETLKTETTQIANIGHNLLNKQTDENGNHYFAYYGGEMTVDYWLSIETAKEDKADKAGVGIWILIDGIPQPYRLNDGEDYSYMHMVFPGTSGERTYSLSFVPTVGKAGDELEMNVLFVLAPKYQGQTSGQTYGVNGLFDAVDTMLKYEADSTEIAAPENAVLTSMTVSSREVTIEERNEFLIDAFCPVDSNGNPDLEEDKFNQVFFITYIDDEAETNKRYAIDGKEQITLRVDGMRGFDVTYRLVVYMDGQPIGWTEFIEHKDGEMTSIEMVLDVTGIEDRANLTIVYATVGEGGDDESYWALYNRVLLYREKRG